VRVAVIVEVLLKAVVTWFTAKLPTVMTEESSLVADSDWAREACAFIIFIHNVVHNFVASERLLLACSATLRFVGMVFKTYLCE